MENSHPETREWEVDKILRRLDDIRKTSALEDFDEEVLIDDLSDVRAGFGLSSTPPGYHLSA